MKLDAQRQLTRMIWRERLRRRVPVVLLGAVLFGIAAYVLIPGEVENERLIEGVVSSWSRPQTHTGSGNAVITITLDDGSHAVAGSRSRNAPEIGARIKVRARIFSSGRVTYTWIE